jgi:lipopolysaccharide biosynthesis regulator YciM
LIPVDPLWLLALPILFGLGWFTARLDRRQTEGAIDPTQDHLIQALMALVDQQPGAALDALLAAVREHPENLELQQAAGSLFRRIGAPDRAIEVHLSLLGRPQLPTVLREACLLELARDYMDAGIMDRAQDSLELLSSSPLHAATALTLLVDLMQRQRRWEDALAALDRLSECPGAEPEAALRFHLLMELNRVEEARALLPGHPRLASPQAPNALAGPQVCVQCGFQARQPTWQCPGCRSWDSLRHLA